MGGAWHVIPPHGGGWAEKGERDPARLQTNPGKITGGEQVTGKYLSYQTSSLGASRHQRFSKAHPFANSVVVPSTQVAVTYTRTKL